MTTKEKAEIMLAHAAGAEVEWRNSLGLGPWYKTDKDPGWDWMHNIYRIKPREPRRIWVNEYEDGSKYVHDSIESSNTDMIGQNVTPKVTEFVEVIKP